MKKREKQLSAEEKIIKGLENFADALEGDREITELYTCRKVVLNLRPITPAPDLVKKARQALGVSQTLFAQFIGASKSCVQKWERGDRDPEPMACRFMEEILADPSKYRKRFLELATPVTAS